MIRAQSLIVPAKQTAIVRNWLPQQQVYFHQRSSQTERSLLLHALSLQLGRCEEIFQQANGIYQFNTKRLPKLSHLNPTTIKAALEPLVTRANQLKVIREAIPNLHQKQGQVSDFAFGIQQLLTKWSQSTVEHIRCLREECGSMETQQPTGPYPPPMTLLAQQNKSSPLLAHLCFVVDIQLKQSKPPHILDFFFRLMESEDSYSLHDWNELKLLYGDAMVTLLRKSQRWIWTGDEFRCKIDQSAPAYQQASSQKTVLLPSQPAEQPSAPLIIGPMDIQIKELHADLQFVKSFFNDTEKHLLKDYLGIDSHFESLIDFVKKMMCEERKPIVKNGKNFFKHNQTLSLTISDRLKLKSIKPQPSLKQIGAQIDNPYEMFTIEFPCLGFEQLIQRSPFAFQKLEQQSELKTVSQLNIRQNSQFNLQQTKQHYHPQSPYIIHRLQSAIRSCIQAIAARCKTLLTYRHTNPLDRLNKADRISSAMLQTLNQLKDFILQQRGDYIDSLLDLLAPQLNGLASKISFTHIHSLIQEPLASPCPNLAFTFIKNKTSLPVVNQQSGWAVFALSYKPTPPLDHVFTESIIDELSTYFNFAFRMRKVEQTMVDLVNIFNRQDFGTDTNKSIVSGMIDADYTSSKSRRFVKLGSNRRVSIAAIQSSTSFQQGKLHHSLLQLINSLLSYLLLKAISLWTEFSQQIVQASSLSNMKVLVAQVVTKIKNETFGSKNLYDYAIMISDTAQAAKKGRIQPSDLAGLMEMSKSVAQLQ